MPGPGGACTPWLTVDEAVQRRPKAAELDNTVLRTAIEYATDIVYVATARQFVGTCPVTVRPTAAPYGWTPASWAAYFQDLSGTGWYSSWGMCRGALDHSSCGVPGGLRLPGYPVQDIIQVTVDGVVLDPATYQVLDYRLLTRNDGSGWPTCQDWRLPPTEVGTFEVQYHYGMEPPEGGKTAVAVLAEKVGQSMSGQNSGLPARLSNLSSLTRQGVSASFVDPMQFLDKGRVGVYEVDLFISQVNPLGAKRPSLVYSPDRGRSHTVTWTS